MRRARADCRSPDEARVTVSLAVSGLEPPLSSLVPAGEPPFAVPSFEAGSTLPLRLSLECGGVPARGGAAIRIVGLAREGDGPLDLDGVDLDSGNSNDGGLEFRASGGKWVFNLSTARLGTGTWTLTLEAPDGRRYDATFLLR